MGDYQGGEVQLSPLGEPGVHTPGEVKKLIHVAFSVDAKELPQLRKRIKAVGLEILPGRKRTANEGESIYFYDYDNHLFELHSGDLAKRIRYYKRQDAKLWRLVLKIIASVLLLISLL